MAFFADLLNTSLVLLWYHLLVLHALHLLRILHIIPLLQLHYLPGPLLRIFDLLPRFHLLLFKQGDAVCQKLSISLDILPLLFGDVGTLWIWRHLVGHARLTTTITHGLICRWVLLMTTSHGSHFLTAASHVVIRGTSARSNLLSLHLKLLLAVVDASIGVLVLLGHLRHLICFTHFSFIFVSVYSF